MKEEGKSIWRNKDFMLLFLGGLVSRIGNGIHNIALVWLVLELTGSGTATGTILLLSTLPGVLVGPFGGLIADRVNRKLLIVGNDFLRGIIVIWLGWTIYIDQSGFFILGIATVLMSISGSFFNPAIGAVLPTIVYDENLEKANSLENISMNFTQIIGAALGGILIGFLGMAGAFFFNGISFIISGISELFINIPAIKKEIATKTSFFADFKYGLEYIYNRKVIFSLFIVFLFLNFLFSGLYAVALPYIYNQLLKVNSIFFGIAKSVFPAGAIIGSVLINYYVIKNHRQFLAVLLMVQSGLLITIGLPISPFALIRFSTDTIYYILLFIFLLTGIFNALINIPLMTLLQRLIPDNLRGRIMGLLGTLTQGLIPISMGLTGIVLDKIPPYLLFILSGTLSVLISSSIMVLPIFNEFSAIAKLEGKETI